MALLTILPTILLLLLPSRAFAWGADGHRFVCTVASYEMNEPTRAAVKRLLHIDSREQFAELCTWADEAVAQRPETAGWHRMYVPKDAHTVDLARDCADPNRCVIAVLERNAQVLRGIAADTAKAEALKFVMHLVGDLHQPLNVGYADDGGGAGISAVFRGRTTTIREVWEDGLLKARPESWRETAESYDKRFTYVERRQWPAGTPLDWANESLYIVRTPATGYLGNPGGLEFGDLYIRQNQLIAIRRMSQAGVRLATMLNKIFGE